LTFIRCFSQRDNDMRNPSLGFMTANFGKAGRYYYWISRGIDERPVSASRVRKSFGSKRKVV
jgi:DNA polymerase-4